MHLLRSTFFLPPGGSRRSGAGAAGRARLGTTTTVLWGRGRGRGREKRHLLPLISSSKWKCVEIARFNLEAGRELSFCSSSLTLSLSPCLLQFSLDFLTHLFFYVSTLGGLPLVLVGRLSSASHIGPASSESTLARDGDFL